MSTFFAQFFTWLNAQLDTYLSTKLAAVAVAIEPAAVTMATIYVMIWGYMHLRGTIREPIVDGAVRIAVVVFVLGIALRLWMYHEVITSTFYRGPDQLAAAIVGAPATISTLDQIWTSGSLVAEQFLTRGSLLSSDLVYYLAGFLVYIFVGATVVYTAFLIALSKIALSIILALGPIFIILLLFDATKRFFEAWIGQLANYALIAILAVLVASLMLTSLSNIAASTAARGAAITIADSLAMCVFSVLIFLVMRQVMTIAAGLASGIALSTYSAMSRTTAWALGGVSRSGYQLTRGLFDRETTRWDSLRRKAGYQLGRGVRGALSDVRSRPNTVSRDKILPPPEQRGL